jgi:hypothetical protein
MWVFIDFWKCELGSCGTLRSPEAESLWSGPGRSVWQGSQGVLEPFWQHYVTISMMIHYYQLKDVLSSDFGRVFGSKLEVGRFSNRGSLLW